MDVPLDSISVDGVAPEPGDIVDFSVEARVETCDNGKASVTLTKVNGQEVESAPEDQGEGQEEPLDQMGGRIRSQMDGGY